MKIGGGVALFHVWLNCPFVIYYDRIAYFTFFLSKVKYC